MRLLLLVIAVALSSCALGKTLGAVPISVHPVTQRLVDEHFREVYFHGVNVVVKGFPWIPETDHFDPLTSFSTKDMEALQSLGLNGIRLGTMWPGVEPVRGQYNQTYLKALHDLVEKAATYDIYSLLDMHQDVMSEKFCGEGVPLWAAVPDNNSQFPEPRSAAYTVNNESIPTFEECHSASWAGYYFTKAAGTAFQNLYDNADGLRTSWANFWGTVAQVMAPLGSAVLGYELMNEPWAGDAVGDILLMLPGVADKVNLQQMWDVGAAAIRTYDISHAIWFEGVTWDWFNVGFTQVPGGPQWKNKSVLSYHFYIPPDFNVQTQLSARMDDIKRLGCGGFLTELMPQTSVFDALDEYKQGWLIWEYKPFVGNRTGWATSIWNNNGTMNMAAASQLSRTYAQVVAGVTQTLRYNSNDHSFILIFQADTQFVTANTTKIYLNEALHYPNGFNVVATTTGGSGAVTWTHVSVNHIEVQHNSQLLKQGLVTVEITPK